MSIASTVIEARVIPVTLENLQYLFKIVEDSNPLEPALAHDGSRFQKAAVDFYADGFTPADASLETLMEAWLMQQSLSMHYSANDAEVTNGAAKAYDYRPRGREFKGEIEDFKTYYMHASHALRADFLQVHADAIQKMLVDRAGVAA